MASVSDLDDIEFEDSDWQGTLACDMLLESNEPEVRDLAFDFLIDHDWPEEPFMKYEEWAAKLNGDPSHDSEVLAEALGLSIVEWRALQQASLELAGAAAEGPNDRA